jgi:hypothetical protein
VTDWQYITCPNFVRKDSAGDLEGISCKICGTVIAERMERPVGYEVSRTGETVKVVTREFVRFPSYSEIKIALDSGGFHVTHICSTCAQKPLTPDTLLEVYRADQEESPDGYTDREREVRPVGVVQVLIGGKAIE